MAQQRRPGRPSRGPRDGLTDARGARRTPGGRRGARPGRPAVAGRPTATARARRVAARPRFTGRALVLLLVVAALVASYASSLGAYVDQRQHVASLHEQIEDSESAIADLRREKKRWRDDAYVIAQARARFAFGFPGEIGYQVLDEDGQPLDHEDSLPVPTARPSRTSRSGGRRRWSPSASPATRRSRARACPVEKITTPPDLRAPTE